MKLLLLFLWRLLLNQLIFLYLITTNVAVFIPFCVNESETQCPKHCFSEEEIRGMYPVYLQSPVSVSRRKQIKQYLLITVNTLFSAAQMYFMQMFLRAIPQYWFRLWARFLLPSVFFCLFLLCYSHTLSNQYQHLSRFPINSNHWVTLFDPFECCSVPVLTVDAAIWYSRQAALCKASRLIFGSIHLYFSKI